MTNENIWRYLKSLVAAGLILFATAIYWYGAEVQLTHLNTRMLDSDQYAYLDYARSLYESDYAFIGRRNQMPAYPFLQSLFLRSGMTDEVFFQRGKYVNLVLSLVLLAGLALIFRRFFSRLHSLSLLMIVAFTVFIFKAGFFQAELLFYFESFCLFLLLWSLLKRPSWRLAILTGIVAGLAHLTKASIMPALVIFTVIATARWGWAARRNRHSSEDAVPSRLIDSHLVSALLVGVVFLLTIFPYINTSKKVFGQYFYNVNTNYFIWYDSWEDVRREKMGKLYWSASPGTPSEELPSMSKYWREHTVQQMTGRFDQGGRKVLQNVVYSYGYHRYIAAYLCLLIIAMAVSWPRARQAISSNPEVCLFLLMYFASYLALYAWYAPIADGNRLVLAQFLPLLFAVSKGLHTLWGSSRIETRGHSVSVMTILNSTILLLVVIDAYFTTTQRVYTVFGGY